jgi:signal transduction histidine kinase
MTRSVSITRRLTLAVLVLELLSALALIGALTVYERHTQLKAFDATLRATAESLMGAVQDEGDEDDNVVLDTRGLEIGKDAIFRVEEKGGKVLGLKGSAPMLDDTVPSAPVFQNVRIAGRQYRFLVLHGVRTVDPGKSNGGVRHNILILYGTPVGHVWHEVVEAIRFFAIATAVLLGITAGLMVWLVRKGLSPLRELALEAERISSKDWQFDPSDSARETVELRPLTAALEAALARLQRSFEQQKRFTSDAAHELKTDVAIVKSSLQLLSMRRRSVEEYSQGLALSLEDFTRLEMTVQKMLTLARLEQPVKRLGRNAIPYSCPFREVIEEAVQQARPLAELKAVKIVVVAEEDVGVGLDRHDALLLCSNILLNALQHSPQGAKVQIELTVDASTAKLRIYDEGEGISDEDRPYVFEPFYRGDPSRNRKSGGTGLGLSICKEICERAGGSIVIATSPAGGALVTASLPIEKPVISSEYSASIKVR